MTCDYLVLRVGPDTLHIPRINKGEKESSRMEGRLEGTKDLEIEDLRLK